MRTLKAKQMNKFSNKRVYVCSSQYTNNEYTCEIGVQGRGTAMHAYEYYVYEGKRIVIILSVTYISFC